MSEEKKDSIRDLYQKFLEDPELNAEKLIARLQSMKESWLMERDKINSRIWRNNVQFYGGNHYIRDAQVAASPYRVKLRENHVNNTINRMLSIFTQNLPIVRVFPNSDQNQDVLDAETTETYMKYFWRTKKLETKLIKHVKYSLIFGNSFVHWKYNPDLGGKISLGTEDTESGKKEIEEYRGDIETFIDDPLKILVRPGIDEMDEMYDIIRISPVSKAMLEQKYGKIESDGVNVYSIHTNENRKDDDNAVLCEYYHKPTPWFEEGLYVAWVGKKILKCRPSTNAEENLPFGHLAFDKVPARFWGMSSIEQVMDLQEQLNRAASMIIEARNLVARPRVFASHEAKVPAQSLTDRPGEIIKFAQAGGMPQFAVPNFNFAEMSNHKADVRNAISQVTGITSASRGEVPAATKTALALQLVLEQDRSQYLPFIKNFHQTILDMAYGILSEAACNFDKSDPRVVKIEGTTYSSRLFHGGMVPSPLDITLEDTNPLGWTAAGRVEQIQALADMGVLTDRNQILEMLKLHSPDPAFQLQNINRQAQQKENELLNRGQMVEIGPEDDDAVHMDEIVKVIASFEFRSKPKPVQDALLAHAEAHKARIQQFSGGKPQPGTSVNAKGSDLAAQQAMLQAPQPGQNIEELLRSSRAG